MIFKLLKSVLIRCWKRYTKIWMIIFKLWLFSTAAGVKNEACKINFLNYCAGIVQKRSATPGTRPVIARDVISYGSRHRFKTVVPKLWYASNCNLLRNRNPPQLSSNVRGEDLFFGLQLILGADYWNFGRKQNQFWDEDLFFFGLHSDMSKFVNFISLCLRNFSSARKQIFWH